MADRGAGGRARTGGRTRARGPTRHGRRTVDGALGAAGPNRLYVVATWVPRRTTIAVGALGPVTFARGWYTYVGSARRGRDARVARHLRAEKPLRWHADHLFARFPGRAAWLVDGELSECELAAALAAWAESDGASVRVGSAARRPPRFGAGDCGCAGHLLRLAQRPTTASVRALLRRGAVARRFRAS